MEENKELIIIEKEKPEFNSEIKVEIKSIGAIESNISEAKSYALALKEFYKNIQFSEDTVKIAKEERAKVNKFLKSVGGYRKNVTIEFNKPLDLFNGLSKETEDILKETSDLIAEQINLYDEQKKKDKENEVKEYFEELKKANNIDFLKYEQAKINVTLTASLKSLKEQAKGFIAEILDDLELINLQSHKEEILFEYKLNLNVTKSITMVSSRFEALEREKARQEELAKKKVEIAKLIIAEKTQEGQKNYEESFIPKEEKLQAPVVETQKVEEPIYTVKFAVKGTKTQLKELKEFLINGGYEYESIN